MERDEEGTHERITRLRRELIEPTITEHYGRLVKTTGDGFLAMFDSPVEAVRCAIVIQQSMIGRNASLPRDKWLQYRIGVNLGDVIVEDDDIYGEGVNIAARLQTLANPGGVYISGGVYEQIKGKLVVGYQSLGDEKLKNITDPVRVYRVLADPTAVSQARHFNWLMVGTAAVAVTMVILTGWFAWSIGHILWTSSGTRTVQTPQQPSTRSETAARDAPVLAPADSSQQQAQGQPQRTSPAAEPAKPAPAPQPDPARSAGAGTAPPGRDASQPAQQEAARPALPPAAPATESPPPPTPGRDIARTESPVIPAPAQPSARPEVPGPQVAAAAAPRVPLHAPPAGSPEVFRDCNQCPEMLNLPAGKFRMGSDDDPSEKPVREINVAAFALGRFPVTVGEWKHCVADQACTHRPSGDDDAPVRNISWNDAQQYVAWLSKVTQKQYRLPTEAEWEYAARGRTSTKFWWGNQFAPGLATCRGCEGQYDPENPFRVGNLAPNPFGLYDLVGSVGQWVADCWHRNYAGAPKDASSWETPNCRERVLRGGSWKNDVGYLRSSSRDRYDANVRYFTHGLRVARSL